MIFSFTGAQSTGKTTLLTLCKALYSHKGYQFVDEVTRDIKRKGFDINNEASSYDNTQLQIWEHHMNNISRKGNWILDRCIFDGYVYTKYFYENDKVSKKTYNILKESFEKYLNRYSKIFYTDPKDVKLIDDGERSTDVKFRERIIEIYEEIGIEKFENVVKISGTVSERMQTLKNFLI